MVKIRERIKGKKKYYYLEHSVRVGGKVEKKEKYLGTKIPNNTEELKKDFLNEMNKKLWFPIFENIRDKHIKNRKNTPLSSRKEELEKFSIRFTYDTQRIEGSKLTLRETANLLQKNITPHNKPISDVKEAEAHDKLFRDIIDHQKDLSLQLVLQWHKELFNVTREDIAGKIRKHGVMITGSKFVPSFPSEIDPLLRDFFSWYNKNKDKTNGVELAALTHLKFVTIHPFSDGNGRISRLIMNFVLNKKKYPMLNISYENRDSYYNALERAQVKKEDEIFVKWFFRKYKKEYRHYLK